MLFFSSKSVGYELFIGSMNSTWEWSYNMEEAREFGYWWEFLRFNKEILVHKITCNEKQKVFYCLNNKPYIYIVHNAWKINLSWGLKWLWAYHKEPKTWKYS